MFGQAALSFSPSATRIIVPERKYLQVHISQSFIRQKMNNTTQYKKIRMQKTIH